MQMRMVQGGSSYLSQSELPVTFGLGGRDRVERVVLDWPSGGTQEFKNLRAGKAYQVIDPQNLRNCTVLVLLHYCGHLRRNL